MRDRMGRERTASERSSNICSRTMWAWLVIFQDIRVNVYPIGQKEAVRVRHGHVQMKSDPGSNIEPDVWYWIHGSGLLPVNCRHCLSDHFRRTDANTCLANHSSCSSSLTMIGQRCLPPASGPYWVISAVYSTQLSSRLVIANCHPLSSDDRGRLLTSCSLFDTLIFVFPFWPTTCLTFFVVVFRLRSFSGLLYSRHTDIVVNCPSWTYL